MAIVVEGQKEKNISMQVTIIAVILSLISLVAYYIFFKNPPFVEVAVPQNIEKISKFSGIVINDEDIINSDIYKSLVDYVGKPIIGELGRENPFTRF